MASMRKLSVPVFGVLALAGLAIGGPTYVAVNYVSLQASSPGTAESGHINITGNAVASTVRVDGANVNAGGLTPGLRFGSSATGEGIFSDRTATGINHHGLDFTAGNTPRMSITNTGNVGIGTRTPAESLSVVGNGDFSGKLTAANMPAVKVVETYPMYYVPAGDFTAHQAFSTTVNVPSDGYLDVTTTLGIGVIGSVDAPNSSKMVWIVLTDNGAQKMMRNTSIGAHSFTGGLTEGTVWPVSAGTHTITLSYCRLIDGHTLVINDARGIIRYIPKGL